MYDSIANTQAKCLLGSRKGKGVHYLPRQEGMRVNINRSEKGLYWRSVVKVPMNFCVPQRSPDR